MYNELMLHINETLSDAQRETLLTALGNRSEGMHARHDSTKPHLLFVAYDTARLQPHDIVQMASAQGVHAQMVDL